MRVSAATKLHRQEANSTSPIPPLRRRSRTLKWLSVLPIMNQGVKSSDDITVILLMILIVIEQE